MCETDDAGLLLKLKYFASAADSEGAVEAGSSPTSNIGKTTKLLRSLQESYKPGERLDLLESEN